MRVHLVQLDIVWEDPQANFARVDRLLTASDVREGDLVLLPEMFDTGFSLNTDATADKNAATDRYLIGLADDLGCLVQGGRTVRDCDCTHATNEVTIAAPGGRVLARYAKIHPFTFGREPEKFVGGRDVVTFPWDAAPGRRLTCCPAICYDLRFPELFRLGLAAGAEAFCLGANWPAARQHHWRALAVARAIENQAYVFAVNRTGRDPFLEYAGGSIVVGPQGKVVGELGDDEAVLSIEVQPDSVRAWRETFPAWRDVRLIDAPGASR